MEEAPAQPGIEERRALIQRIAASNQFKRSARLRELLLYLGNRCLKEGCPEIHEQELGAKVFGRPASYDTSQDNIVRVNASELRKRIEAYFAGEGADETLLLEIPRGSYKPIFSRRVPVVPAEAAVSVHKAASEEPVAGHTAATSAPKPDYRVHLVWGAISLALAILCAALVIREPAAQKSAALEGRPAVAALWTDFVQSSQNTDIVLPDASVSMREEITGKAMSLPDYIDLNKMRRLQSTEVSADRRADLEAIFGHNLVAFGDVRAAQAIVGLAPASQSLRLTFARFLMPEAVKRNSLVLIGGKKANPWVHLFDGQTNFSLDTDKNRSLPFITNRHPRSGEKPSYEPWGDPNYLMGYSVVAYLPNPARTGKVIILAGTDSDATNAAAEFLTSESQLSNFRKTLGVDKFPYFEVLLKTSRLNGTSFSAELISYRTYPELQ